MAEFNHGISEHAQILGDDPRGGQGGAKGLEQVEAGTGGPFAAAG